MLVHKITDGFVIQVYDTEKQKWVSQEFIAGDVSELEDADGQILEDDALKGSDGTEAYLPFVLVQPSANGTL